MPASDALIMAAGGTGERITAPQAIASGATVETEGALVDDYSLLDLFWTMLWFFLFVAWIWLLITIVADIFRSRDMSGWGKALWTLLIIVLPILGSLVYLIARGARMAERIAEEHGRHEAAFRAYVRDVATSSDGSGGSAGTGVSTADELEKLSRLREAGTLSEEEFAAQKAKLLG